jgi:heme/copper-type cytochrome/quinol oxidase subunit 2
MRRWIPLTLVGISLLILVFSLWQPPNPVAARDETEHVIHVDARSFAFEPEIIRVQHGDRVVIELESLDATHGIFLDGYELGVEAEPGNPARLEFTADRAGSFRFRCSVACGNLHPFMIGQLKVGPNRPFRWSLAALTGVTLAVVLYYGWRRDHTE